MILDELSMMTEQECDLLEEVTGAFVPRAPGSLLEAGVSEIQCEGLILRFLLNRGVASGTDISAQVCLPFRLIDEELRRMKKEQLVSHRSSSSMHDYLYELTSTGHDRARRTTETTTYFGAAPVPLETYIESVEQQSLRRVGMTPEAFKASVSDLSIRPDVLSQLGQAVRDARSMFLFGHPGNGKTSIAERICQAFGQEIWIPKAINIDGETVRLYDPIVHKIKTIPVHPRIDARWVRVERPTIVAGGELTLENLELTKIAGTGVTEAALQLKSNCGVLVIDDFGRQRMGPEELLNRWIVPLEKGFDYLNMPSGKKVRMPFEQMVVFSTNLAPKDLVDEAFLRRIPYKILAPDPTERDFVELLLKTCQQHKLSCDPATIQYLLDRHYRPQNRGLRYCHARDLVQQMLNACEYEQLERRANSKLIDIAARNYFVDMEVEL
ncbi:MAG: AAA family ATPase [Planctomycetaceae bacterium]|nr:AAA family ATPase [Planctomycetaceae bacterium]